MIELQREVSFRCGGTGYGHAISRTSCRRHKEGNRWVETASNWGFAECRFGVERNGIAASARGLLCPQGWEADAKFVPRGVGGIEDGSRSHEAGGGRMAGRRG